MLSLSVSHTCRGCTCRTFTHGRALFTLRLTDVSEMHVHAQYTLTPAAPKSDRIHA